MATLNTLYTNDFKTRATRSKDKKQSEIRLNQFINIIMLIPVFN